MYGTAGDCAPPIWGRIGKKLRCVSADCAKMDAFDDDHRCLQEHLDVWRAFRHIHPVYSGFASAARYAPGVLALEPRPAPAGCR